MFLFTHNECGVVIVPDPPTYPATDEAWIRAMDQHLADFHPDEVAQTDAADDDSDGA